MKFLSFIVIFFVNLSSQTRVLVDGVYDIFHYGHANGLRQVKEFAIILVAGVNSSELTGKSKNNTIMTDKERIKILQSCKWVDEVIGYTPYTINTDYASSVHCI